MGSVIVYILLLSVQGGLLFFGRSLVITVYDPIVRTFPPFSAVYTRAVGTKPNSAHLLTYFV